MSTPLAELIKSQQQLQEVLGGIARFMREAKDGAQNKVHGFYREARRIVEAYDTGAGLQVRPEIINLVTTLSTTTLTGSAEIRLPENEDFILLRAVGHLLVQDWPAEDALDSPKSRLLVKANNCKVNFKMKDDTRIFTKKNDLTLSSILPELTSNCLDFMGKDGAPPFVIAHAQTPYVTMTLQSSSADVVGGAAEYGLALYGVHISRASR